MMWTMWRGGGPEPPGALLRLEVADQPGVPEDRAGSHPVALMRAAGAQPFKHLAVAHGGAGDGQQLAEEADGDLGVRGEIVLERTLADLPEERGDGLAHAAGDLGHGGGDQLRLVGE